MGKQYKQAIRTVGAIMFSILLATHAYPQQQDPTDILLRLDRHESGTNNLDVAVYSNPALRQFKNDYNITSVSAGYGIEHQSEATCTQAGTGSDDFSFDASTYVKHKNSTIWGEGSYENGHLRSPVWNEVADAYLVYPFFTADEIGGDMKKECYSFSGGYASLYRNMVFGTNLSYKAGQYYRDVDPRPRNITGQLDVSAGIGYKSGKHIIALGASFMTYKQNSDIDFKSELGQTTIYHLTGIGTDYIRFRGNGFNTNYDGQQYGIRLDFASIGESGPFASVNVARLTMETILDDMNKLPMSDIWHNSLDAEAGYKKQGGNTAWAVYGGFSVYRRHGKENYFGDASSSTYPQIGSAEMYADNFWSASVTGLFEKAFRGVTIMYIPHFSYSHRCQIYAEPGREWLVNSIRTSHSIEVGKRISAKWEIGTSLSWSVYIPTKSRLVISDAESSYSGLIDMLYSDFEYSSSNQRFYSVSANVAYALNKRNAIKVTAYYERKSFTNSVFGNIFKINTAWIF